VAVREVEAWLLADQAGIAKLLGIEPSLDAAIVALSGLGGEGKRPGRKLRRTA
jgi:hypothetical protein